MPSRVALLALINPVGPIAECHRRIRMSKPHRLIFTRIGRSPSGLRRFLLVAADAGALCAGRSLIAR